jgi:transposase-like protein
MAFSAALVLSSRIKSLDATPLILQASEICRENGISEQTFYNWKRKYGGWG